MTPFRVLFVCMGNICRSPAGDNVFRHLVAEADLGKKVECDSAGTIGYHTGKAPDRRMTSTLEGRGIPIDGAARQFQPDDFGRFDLILTMDEDNRHGVLALATDDDERRKVRRFTDFCEHFDDPEVPDPYYGGDRGFELVADMIEDGCAGLLAHVRTQMA